MAVMATAIIVYRIFLIINYETVVSNGRKLATKVSQNIITNGGRKRISFATCEVG